MNELVGSFISLNIIIVLVVLLLVGYVIKEIMDMVGVRVYPKMVVKLEYKEQVPKGAEKAFRYVYNYRIKSKENKIVGVVGTIVLTFAVVFYDMYLLYWLIASIVYNLITQVVYVMKVYNMSK